MITEATFKVGEKRYSFSPLLPLDISLPLKSDPTNVNCFYADPVKYETIRLGGFVGSVEEGGVCNYKRMIITPHGNGTHTESYGHISKELFSINDCLRTFHFFAKLLSLEPKKSAEGDLIIRFDDFCELSGLNFNQEPGSGSKNFNALIIRSLPNDDSKKTRQYTETNPPYFEEKIGELLCYHGIQHLLVDLPSVDRESDGGKLSFHRKFWNFPEAPRKEASITELVYVDSAIEDGYYLLNLQIISADLDASPSKPVLYRIAEV